MTASPTVDPQLLNHGDQLRRVDLHDVDCGAIYDETEAHRYVLWRLWQPDRLPLVVIGLNPSTATELALDNTIRRCIQYAKDWGHGGLVMLNLFSFRSTNPKVLSFKQRHWVKAQFPYGPPWPESVTGGPANDAYLLYWTHEQRAGAVLAAWGVHGWIAGRGAIVEDTLRRAGVHLTVLGLTKQFQPLHPLYQPQHIQPKPYPS